MDLGAGYELEEPAVTIPWFARPDDVRRLVPDVEEVTEGYDVVDVVSLGGLRHALGLHYRPRRNGRLVEFEIFRREPIDVQVSFEEFQSHLEVVFGPPTTSRPAGPDRPRHRWRFGTIDVVHLIQDRFGPEEHLRIRRV